MSSSTSDDLLRDFALLREELAQVPELETRRPSSRTRQESEILYWMGETEAPGEPPAAVPAPSVRVGMAALKTAVMAADIDAVLQAFRNLKGPLADAATAAGNDAAHNFILGIDVQNSTPQTFVSSMAQTIADEMDDTVAPLTKALAVKAPDAPTVLNALVDVIRLLRDLARTCGWADGTSQFADLLPVGA